MNYIALKRLFLTADKSRVVEVASHEAGYLFRGLGQIVTQDEVTKYNLGSDLVAPTNPQPTAEATMADTKAPPEKKAETQVPNHKAVLEVPAKKGNGKRK